MTRPRSESNAPGAKMYAAIIAAIVTYLLTQEVLHWPEWAEVALNAVAVGVAAYMAIPQRTIPELGSFAVALALLGAVFASIGLFGLLIIVIIILIVLAILSRSAL